MGCQYIKSEQGGYRITAQLPERFYSNNKRSVQVKLNDFMSCAIRSKNDFKGDIFNLVSYILHDKRGAEMQKDLSNAKEFVCNTFGWNEFLGRTRGTVVATDYTAPLKAIIGRKRKRREIQPNPVLSESILHEFIPYPSYDWIQEGISYKTQKLYGIGFDIESRRIIIPLRNRFGQLVGVKGRLIKTEDDPERKYLYLYRCQNRYEWFNFHYAHTYILIDKKVYIFESEKSCMKAFDAGIYNTVAIGASDISEEQAQMIKQLGLDVEIVLCYDKGISIDEIKEQAKIFEGRKVFAMFDTDNTISGKNAPIDEGIKKWNHLVENNIYEIIA